MGKKITARFMHKVSGFTGDVKLWKLSEPVEYGEMWGGDKKETRYVVTLAVIAPYTGAETYIFPTDGKGYVLNWTELPGSYRGPLDHELAIQNAGWKVE